MSIYFATKVYLHDVEEDEEDEEGVAVDVKRELPLDALLHEERVANALAVYNRK